MIYKQRQASSDALPIKFERECKWVYLRISAKVLLILNGRFSKVVEGYEMESCYRLDSARHNWYHCRQVYEEPGYSR